MNEFSDLLTNYRAGAIDRATLTTRLMAAGFDPGDADALADNQNYTPPGDRADQFIAQQQRQRQAKKSPLLP